MNLSVLVQGDYHTLELEDDASGYVVVGVEEGEVEQVLTTAASPLVDGQVLIGARREVTLAKVVVRVYGATASQIMGRYQAIVTAIGQHAFTITWTVGDAVRTWTCMPGNATPATDAQTLGAGWMDVTVEVPRQPF